MTRFERCEAMADEISQRALDDVIGMIHIKDVLAYWGTSKKFNLRDILRRVVFVAPTLPAPPAVAPGSAYAMLLLALERRCLPLRMNGFRHWKMT